jgi:hypothetical protein
MNGILVPKSQYFACRCALKDKQGCNMKYTI